MTLKKSDVLVSVILYNYPLNIVEIYKSQFNGYRTLFIDNSDNTVGSKKSNVIIANNNTGYAGAANIALSKARELKSEWLLILNQDLKFTNFDSDKLLMVLDKTKIDVLGPFLGYLDKLKWSSVLDDCRESFAKSISYVSGSFIAIKSVVIKSNIDFFEPYFMYYEDVDYCIRVKKAGFSIGGVALVGVHHPTGNEVLRRGSRAHEYYLSRNYLLFIERLAPLHIKFFVFLSIVKDIFYLKIFNKSGALEGVRDYLLRKFYRIPKKLEFATRLASLEIVN